MSFDVKNQEILPAGSGSVDQPKKASRNKNFGEIKTVEIRKNL